MKKILFILLLLLTPFVVKAASEVNITKIELIDKSNGVTINSEPTFNGLKLGFDLSFTNVDDEVKYKVIIENKSKKDYEIDNNTALVAGDYVEYSSSFENDDKIIKANTTRDVIITIKYIKEVPPTLFENGTYTEKKDMYINLSNEQPNPLTSTFIPIYLVVILLVSLLISIIFYHKKQSLLFFIVPILLIPLVVNAIEKLTLEVETSIQIETPFQEGKLTDCYWGREDLSTFYFKPGMTLQQFFDSPYFTYVDERTQFFLDKFANHEFNELYFYTTEGVACLENEDTYNHECDAYRERITDLNVQMHSSSEGLYDFDQCK